MYKYIIEQAGNINWMALFALITFFTVFSISIYMCFIKNQKEIDRMARMPLGEDETIF